MDSEAVQHHNMSLVTTHSSTVIRSSSSSWCLCYFKQKQQFSSGTKNKGIRRISGHRII